MNQYLIENKFRLFIITTAILLGGLIGIRYLTGIIPFNTIFFVLIFLVFSILGLIFPLKSKLDQKYSFTSAILIYALGLVFSFVLFGLIYLSKNYSRNILIANFTWDYQMDLKLRANSSYQLINTNMLDCEVDYGHCNLSGNMLICSDLHFAGVPVRDTLYLSKDSKYLEFKLHSVIKGIQGGRMSVKMNALQK